MNGKHQRYKGVLSYFIGERINTYDANFNLGIFGGVGDGKSMAGLVIARKIDKTFSIKDDIVYSAKDYFDRADYLADNNMAKGKVLMLDEAGTVADAQRWFDEDVKNVVNEMRTNRWQNMCCISVSPSFKDITTRARALVSGYMIPSKTYINIGIVNYRSNINPQFKTSCWNYYHCETNPVSGEQFKYLMRVERGGIVRSLSFKLPPFKFVKEYKTKSFEFKTKLRKMHKEKAMQNEMRFGTTTNYKDIAVKLLEKVKEDKKRWISSHGRIKLEEIEVEFNMGQGYAKKVRAIAEGLEEHGVNKNDLETLAKRSLGIKTN